MMKKSYEDLARRIFRAARIKDNFHMRSGLIIKDKYIDKYLFEADPHLLREIVQTIAPLIPKDVNGLAGLEMGGIPIVTALSQLTGIPALFVRKKAKTYGTFKLVEGGDVMGRKLVIVDDGITTGRQIRKSAKALRELGASIQCALVVIDRELGGVENLQKYNVNLQALFTITELLQIE
jgi:orotate phosphoribosyltransferase